MRNIGEVIDQIKAEIPEEVDTSRLDSIIDSVRYAAPEAIPMWWGELAFWMNTVIIPPLTEEWQVKVVAIFTTWSEDEVRKAYAA